MIICIIGWCLWLCVQVFMACFTPFRHLMLKGKRFHKTDAVLRYMQLRAFWIRDQYAFYFWTHPILGWVQEREEYWANQK